MTTTERPGELSTTAKFSEPFSVVRKGKKLECRTVEMFGQVLEVCDDDRSVRQVLIDLVGEEPWEFGEETETRLLDFLDTYRIERPGPVSE